MRVCRTQLQDKLAVNLPFNFKTNNKMFSSEKTSQLHTIASKLSFPSPTYNYENNTLNDTFSRCVKLAILVLSVLVGLFILLGLATTCYLVYEEAKTIGDEIFGFSMAYVWIEFILLCLRMPFLAILIVILLVGIIAAIKEFTILLCVEIGFLIGYAAILFVCGSHTISLATLAYEFNTTGDLVVFVLFTIASFVSALLIILLILACLILVGRIKSKATYTQTEEQL